MFSSIQRPKVKRLLNTFEFDVLIIGGGITGAGIALDAITRGMSVALVDMQDFAAGTSSRSTKLIHGGLRYLKQLEFKLVKEVGNERAIVYENAPHVTTPEWMLLPFHKGGTFGRTSTSAGLRLYDYLANVSKHERRKMLSAEETIQKEPLLKTEGLLGGGYYVEYKTDDARLTLEVLKKAAERGALCLNYMKVEQFVYNDDLVHGAIVSDQLTGEKLTIHAKKIVNATGPWVDAVRSLDHSSNDRHLRLTKGIHIVIDKKNFPLQQAVYFDAPDGRMIFAIPRGRKTYIGTTDTFFEGDLNFPKATVEEVEYLLQTISYMFPTVKLSKTDVESTWAGVRPLIFEDGKNPSEISRKDEVWESLSGVITIAGGKLTGYRKMAELVVSKVAKGLGDSYAKCRTKHLRLSGGDFRNPIYFQYFIDQKSSEASSYGITTDMARHLASFYGTNVDAVFHYMHMAKVNSDTNLPIWLQAQILYSVYHENAYTPSDLFIRRLGSIYFDINSVIHFKDDVCDFMSKLLNYNAKEEKKFRDELQRNIDDAINYGSGDGG